LFFVISHVSFLDIQQDFGDWPSLPSVSKLYVVQASGETDAIRIKEENACLVQEADDKTLTLHSHTVKSFADVVQETIRTLSSDNKNQSDLVAALYIELIQKA
jgi:hypothetical protein